jgi:hypothetical protein
LACWGVDLASLSRLSVAGVSDAAAQSGVVAVARTALVLLELRLLLVQALVAAALGLLSLAFWPLRRPVSPRAAALGGAAATLVVEALASGAMMARYPQLYSSSWWRVGGWRAHAQRAVTHGLGPLPFEAALALLAAAALSLAGWRLLRGASRRRLAALAAWLVTVVLVALAARGGERPGLAPEGGPPDVLVLAVDSLRSDRVPGDSMPFVTTLVRQGTLFRFAFTPVAHTFPSWVSTLTGREPREHGIRSMFPDRESVEGVPRTLFGELRDEGYRTFVSAHFAGDVFRRFDAGFETLDAPELTVDTLATSTALTAHATALPLLRWSAGRRLFPEWRNVPQLDDPEWLVDATLGRLRGTRGRVAGLVFFGTAHFPYVAPYPFYRAGAGDYRGGFLYDVPPSRGEPVSIEDALQARARYDGALRAVDQAIERLCRELAREGRLARTLLVITADHGEALYEHSGLAGHGDTLEPTAQSVPVLLVGPGVPRGRVSEAQVRLYDLPATVLHLVDPRRPPTFGAGSSLLKGQGARPACVETAVWFWPDTPGVLRGERLVYEPISELLEVEPASRALVLRRDKLEAIEDAKDRGIVLGNRLWHQRSTPRGIRRELLLLPGVTPESADVDLQALFRSRCVDGDPELESVLDAVVHRTRQPAAPGAAPKQECAQCGLGR